MYFRWSKQHRNREKLVILLSDERLDVNAADEEGSTALHFAVSREAEEYNEDELTLLLSRNGLDVNAADERGVVPLHLVVYYLKEGDDKATMQAAMKLLIDKGADPNFVAEGSSFTSPFDLAPEEYRPMIISWVEEYNDSSGSSNSATASGNVASSSDDNDS